MPILPGTNFSQVWDTVVAHVFTPQPKNILIKKGKVIAYISASNIQQVAYMEYVDRKRVMDAVAYACWDADTVILVEPSPTREKIPEVNTPFQEFINQRRPVFSYLDEISGKKNK